MKIKSTRSGRMDLYWLKSELMAETAAFFRRSGAGKSGNPSARLMALHFSARRVSCWMGEGMNFLATDDSFSSMAMAISYPLQKNQTRGFKIQPLNQYFSFFLILPDMYESWHRLKRENPLSSTFHYLSFSSIKKYYLNLNELFVYQKKKKNSYLSS